MGKTIVCHCEDITLNELFSALRQGYTEIESLKRYTGIATGKCQGKCCLVQTLRVLASTRGLEAATHGATRGAGEPLVAPSYDEILSGLRVPTMRQPITPLSIDEIVEQDSNDNTGEHS